MPHSTKEVHTSEAEGEALKLPLAKPQQYMCRKHGNIGRNYFRFETDVGYTDYKQTLHCGFCFREMLDANCERAIPIPEPVEPYVGG